MSEWLNNTIRIHDKSAVPKPCHELTFCPYGELVEEFPLHPEHKDVENLNALSNEELNTGYNCTVFGHDCPVFYHAELIAEEVT